MLGVGRTWSGRPSGDVRSYEGAVGELEVG